MHTVHLLSCIQKYVIRNKDNQHILEGLLAIKRTGVYEAQALLKNAAREFKSEREPLIDSDHDHDLDYIHHESENDSNSDDDA